MVRITSRLETVFEPGLILSKSEFEAAARARPDSLEGAEAAATADISLDLLAAIDYVAASGPNGIAINRHSRGGEGSLVRDGVDHRSSVDHRCCVHLLEHVGAAQLLG